MNNYPAGTGPNDPEAPWNPEMEPKMKTITVFIRFAGVLEKEMQVPADFDCSDSEAISEALNQYTKDTRPDYAFGVERPEDWEFWNWHIGEFAFPSPNFNDPGRRFGMDTPRIYIEDVVED